MTDTLGEVFRREAGRCTATLIRVLGDIDLAEDAVAEAFAIAAGHWPKTGIPPNPGGWITQVEGRRWQRRLDESGVQPAHLHSDALGLISSAIECHPRHVKRGDVPAVFCQPDGVGALAAADVQARPGRSSRVSLTSGVLGCPLHICSMLAYR